ncbi:MAG TPA: DUF6481 family protein [Alphaproteobacteria bacterium]|jgi:hypothetical protein|nr:DUF6481 family protein [Alphaproteobacteria bacterium]
MGVKDTVADRLQAAAKAKQALLERAKAKATDPALAERRAVHNANAAERQKREEQKEAERKAAEERAAVERAAAEAARLEAARLEAERRAAEERAEADRLVALAAEQKAARDARYAARKARQKKKR